MNFRFDIITYPQKPHFVYYQFVFVHDEVSRKLEQESKHCYSDYLPLCIDKFERRYSSGCGRARYIKWYIIPNADDEEAKEDIHRSSLIRIWKNEDAQKEIEEILREVLIDMNSAPIEQLGATGFNRLMHNICEGVNGTHIRKDIIIDGGLRLVSYQETDRTLCYSNCLDVYWLGKSQLKALYKAIAKARILEQLYLNHIKSLTMVHPYIQRDRRHCTLLIATWRRDEADRVTLEIELYDPKSMSPLPAMANYVSAMKEGFFNIICRALPVNNSNFKITYGNQRFLNHTECGHWCLLRFYHIFRAHMEGCDEPPLPTELPSYYAQSNNLITQTKASIKTEEISLDNFKHIVASRLYHQLEPSWDYVREQLMPNAESCEWQLVDSEGKACAIDNLNEVTTAVTKYTGLYANSNRRQRAATESEHKPKSHKHHTSFGAT